MVGGYDQRPAAGGAWGEQGGDGGAGMKLEGLTGGGSDLLLFRLSADSRTLVR